MIKWCLGIWSETDTHYIALDEQANGYYLSPFLENAILFDSIRQGKPLGTVWLPVFVVDDLINGNKSNS